MSIYNLLRDEIHREVESLRKEDIGTDSYKATVDGVTKLVDRVIEMEKMDIEAQNRADNRESEAALKREEMKHERTDRWIKNSISLVSLGVYAGVTVWGTLKTFKFEETGTVTSLVGRGFISNISKLITKK